MAAAGGGGGGGDVVTVKVVVLGNGSAGKTSVCNRLKEDGFAPVYKQTVGVDWHEKTLRIRGRHVVLQLHDIGGQSLSSAMLPQYLAGADVVMLLYDTTDMQSFLDLADWLAVARRHGGVAALGAAAKPFPLMFLLGNKADLTHLRKVSASQHEKFVADNGLAGAYYVSAKTGESVLRAFYAAAAARAGVELTPAELEATDKVIGVHIASTAPADTMKRGDPRVADIEREDREAEARKARGGGCCLLQ